MQTVTVWRVHGPAHGLAMRIGAICMIPDEQLTPVSDPKLLLVWIGPISPFCIHQYILQLTSSQKIWTDFPKTYISVECSAKSFKVILPLAVLPSMLDHDETRRSCSKKQQISVWVGVFGSVMNVVSVHFCTVKAPVFPFLLELVWAKSYHYCCTIIKLFELKSAGMQRGILLCIC